MCSFIILCSWLLVSIISSSQDYTERNDADEESVGYQKRKVPVQVPEDPKDQDSSLLKAALAKGINGIFYSGGGYVSHGEGLVLTWGWFNLLKGLSPTPKKSLGEMFSNKIVSTNSGGGWFFNELLYSKEWNAIVTTADETEMVKKALEYYKKIIAAVYGEETDTLKAKTDSGHFNGFSKGDVAALWVRLIKKGMNNWKGLITVQHSMYEETPVMPVKDLIWRSQFAILQKYGSKAQKEAYYMSTNRKLFADSQRSTWSGQTGYPVIPAEYIFNFDTSLENPKISVDIPSLDDWWTSMCAIRKTKQKCSKSKAKCMENAFCDDTMGYCYCEAGFSANAGVCNDCSKDSKLVGKSIGEKYSKTTTFDLTWEGYFKNDDNQDVPVEHLREIILNSIKDDPKLYSGPSSAAGGITTGDSKAMQWVVGNMGHIEMAWKTGTMATEDGSIKAPSMGLADGGAVDNCGLIGLVRHYQTQLKLKPGIDVWKIASGIDETLLGMCALNDMSLLVNNMNYDGTMGSKERAKVYYPIFTLLEAPKLQFAGEVMEVWSTKVKTLYEPVNGILPGSSFTVFLFFFPQDEGRKVRGLCRNMGLYSLNVNQYGNCEYNNDVLNPKDFNPLLSLLLGRGETFELSISLNLAAKDMQTLASKLGLEDAGDEGKDKEGEEEEEEEDKGKKNGDDEDDGATTAAAGGKGKKEEEDEDKGKNEEGKKEVSMDLPVSINTTFVAIVAGLIILALLVSWFVSMKFQEGDSYVLIKDEAFDHWDVKETI